MKKRYSVAICTLLIASMLASCTENPNYNSSSGTTSTGDTGNTSASASSTVRFMWWGGETRHKATVEAMDLFMENNQDIKVEYEYGGWDGYFDKLLTQLAGNNAPDVVQMSYTNVGEYVVRDQLAPLDPYVESGVLSVDKLNEDLLNVYNIDEHLYAIPAGVNVQLLYYNKDMFTEYGIAEPTNEMRMEEVYDLARELTNKARENGRDDIWGMSAYRGAFDVNFQRMLIDFGGQLWSDDLKTAAFNSPEGVEALEYTTLPLVEGFAPPVEVTVSNPQGITDFTAGRVGMVIDNATSAMGFKETADFEIGMTLSPFGNNKNVMWYQASQVYVITKQSQAPEAAAKVVDYMVNDEEAAQILGFERGIPANSDILATSGEGKDEFEQLELELVNSAAQYTGDGDPMPFPPGYLEIHTEFERLQEAYTYGEMSAEEMLTELESFANKTIAKFN